jgi:RNA methyltransferase, TrmH family
MYTNGMEEITSLQNPQVKYVVKLREDKRQRKIDAQTIVEGKYELELALTSGLNPKEVFYCKDFCEEIPQSLTELETISVKRQVFEKMSQRENPDGWIAIVPTPARDLDSFNSPKNPFFILTESVEKPGNLGAILRTADAAGVDGLIVSDPRVDLFNPHVVRASRGTLFTVPAFEIDNTHALNWLRSRKIVVVASSPEAITHYTEIDYKVPICILVGTEDKGLSDFWLENADVSVQIPMAGKVNSLNVSTSTAILLYEVVRQRSLS